MTALGLIDEVAVEPRARLRTRREQADRIDATIAELKVCDPNDPFFSVANAELQDASNARRALDGEMKLLEIDIAEQIEHAREEAHEPYTAAQRQDYAEMGKVLDKARAIRRRMVDRREQHMQYTGALNVDGIAYGWLEHLDATIATLRAEGAL